MYLEFLSFLETSWLGQTARSSVWLYPLSNLAHVLGAALLVGSIVVFDVLIFRRRYAEALAISRYALTIAALGLAVMVVSGPVLFSAEATATGVNPMFRIKLALILVGLANIALYHALARSSASGIPPLARLHAGVSASVWIAVLLAGRSIAYW
jgi:hypothetical protein